jgi:HEAT repeat protein
MMPATHPVSIHSRLASTDPEVRRIAVMDLLDSDEDDVDKYLLDALKDADAKVRAEAARLLEGDETHEVVEGLACWMTTARKARSRRRLAFRTEGRGDGRRTAGRAARRIASFHAGRPVSRPA